VYPASKGIQLNKCSLKVRVYIFDSMKRVPLTFDGRSTFIHLRMTL